MKYITILHTAMQHSLDFEFTKDISPLRVIYGVSLGRILEKNDHVIMVPYSSYIPLSVLGFKGFKTQK